MGWPEQAKNEDARVTGRSQKTTPHRGVKASIWGAFVLLVWDGAIGGTFLLSLIVCPIWLLVSILKNAIQRSGWRLSLLRIAIPALTFGLVLANSAVQLRIAETNAPRVVAACEEYYADNGQFPKTLDELVPRYLSSVPRAKYCLSGKFLYMNYHDYPLLMWYTFPILGRNVYYFEEGEWKYVD